MRIESVEKKASGTAKIAVGGLSFTCDSHYFEVLGIDAEDLVVGVEIDEAACEDLALADAATEVARQAASLLARAEQSRYLLSAKLAKKGRAAKPIALALDRLESEGLLSDRRYAEAWLRSHVGRTGQSPSRLALGLRAKGISEEDSKAAILEVFGPEERDAALLAAIKKEEKRLISKGLSGRRGRSELISRLRGLGFKPGDIRSFFEKRDEEE